MREFLVLTKVLLKSGLGDILQKSENKKKTAGRSVCLIFIYHLIYLIKDRFLSTKISKQH